MIAGVAGAGKTELAFDIVLNASLMHDWRWLVLSPETGDKFEIVEFLIEKLALGKSVEQGAENAITKDDYDDYLIWINQHFRILDPTDNWKGNFKDLQLNINNLFEAVDYEEGRLGGEFDGIVIDPFNELDIEIGRNTAQVVKNELDSLIAWSKKKNYLTILTNHCNDKQEIRDKNDQGDWFHWTPPTKIEEWAYGQQFGRKGYQMLLIYQRHTEQQIQIANSGDNQSREMMHSCTNGYNIREIFVQKTKPKGVGKTGKFYLFYDKARQRYYNLNDLDMKQGVLSLRHL